MHSLLFTYSPLLHDCTLRSGTHRSIQPTRTYRPHLPGPVNAVLIRPAALRAIGEKILERKCSCIAYLHSSNFSTSNYRVPILSVPPHRWNTTTTKQTDKDCCLIPHANPCWSRTPGRSSQANPDPETTGSQTWAGMAVAVPLYSSSYMSGCAAVLRAMMIPIPVSIQHVNARGSLFIAACRHDLSFIPNNLTKSSVIRVKHLQLTVEWR